MYDYLDVYFDFCSQNCEDPKILAKAKEIVKKYEKFPIESFKKMFDKVKE